MANSGFWVVEFLQWLCGFLQAPSFISLSHLEKNAVNCGIMWETEDYNPIDSIGWSRESLEPETSGGTGKAVAQQEPGTFPAPRKTSVLVDLAMTGEQDCNQGSRSGSALWETTS